MTIEYAELSKQGLIYRPHDDLYATAGPKAVDQCQVSLQFFRRDYHRGEHLPFDQIYRHATEGKMVIYVVTARGRGRAR